MKSKEKLKEFKGRTKEELSRSLILLFSKLRQLKFDLASGKVKNVKEIRETKKDIARIKTIIKQKKEN